MNKFINPIRVAYPSGNTPIFEEWFAENYKGCNTDRELLPIFPTSYHVNHNYGNDENARKFLQDYCDNLDPSKKYFIICQYDDGTLIDWKGKDVLEFNMSKKIGVEMPLLCQPQPFNFNSQKKYLASFIGSVTHPIRKELERFKYIPDWYISFEPHSIEAYCKIISESVFSLCPRGYGANSFRIIESIQYGAIPVYISDVFIEPFGENFSNIGFKYDAENILTLEGNLKRLAGDNSRLVIDTYEKLPEWYEKYYTYEGAMAQIIKCLENAPKG